jgi:hypothetical protein
MQTRVLSVIAFYHLAFFAIGIAMLGMTAGALARSAIFQGSREGPTKGLEL